MNKSRLLGAVCACLSVISFDAGAIPVSADWQTSGDGLITYDASTGLEWLDLTVTASMSYNTVSSQLGTGGIYDGWSYASIGQVATLFDSFGGTSPYDYVYSTANNGLFKVIAPLMGDLYCFNYPGVCTDGNGYSSMLTMEGSGTAHNTALIWDPYYYSNNATYDIISTSAYSQPNDYAHYGLASALVRVASVPIPAAIWLFGSGLLGLIGIARRKKAT